MNNKRLPGRSVTEGRTDQHPWADPKSRSTLVLKNLNPRSTGVLESRIGDSTYWILPGIRGEKDVAVFCLNESLTVLWGIFGLYEPSEWTKVFWGIESYKGLMSASSNIWHLAKTLEAASPLLASHEKVI